MVGIIKELRSSFARREGAVHCSLLVAGGSCEQGLADPIFDREAHLLESSFEEVISGVNADQFLGVGESVNERFELSGGTELIARAADEEFGLEALAQEFEIVDAVFNSICDGDCGRPRAMSALTRSSA
jgi:hypothetical protein